MIIDIQNIKFKIVYFFYVFLTLNFTSHNLVKVIIFIIINTILLLLFVNLKYGCNEIFYFICGVFMS